jgi:probable rRNA maturation factor
MPVAVRNLQRRVRLSPARVARTAGRALRLLGRADRDLDVTLVGDAAIRRLNASYHHRDSPTDVLAFDLAVPGPSALLGEIVISAEMAARQAASVNVPVDLEVDLMVIHGLLHLVGYDDAEPRDARLMHARARAILSRCAAREVPERLWAGLLQA